MLLRLLPCEPQVLLYLVKRPRQNSHQLLLVALQQIHMTHPEHQVVLPPAQEPQSETFKSVYLFLPQQYLDAEIF